MSLLLILSLSLSLGLNVIIVRRRVKEKSTVNPLYVRCSCTHLANMHNTAGCVHSNCMCRVRYGRVLKHGVSDSEMYLQHVTGEAFSLNAMTKQKMFPTLTPSEVITNRQIG